MVKRDRKIRFRMRSMNDLVNILLIEDDESLSRGISFKLKKEGFSVISPTSLKEARDL